MKLSVFLFPFRRDGERVGEIVVKPNAFNNVQHTGVY